eukprot:Seg1852.3 transcript_id=Seg1852.3/GoldUCD/mRNA.D3Y31 product="Potassium channel subfamily K member 10" protein_id=Seg1852.3/GoldUCD/D3Y31
MVSLLCHDNDFNRVWCSDSKNRCRETFADSICFIDHPNNGFIPFLYWFNSRWLDRKFDGLYSPKIQETPTFEIQEHQGDILLVYSHAFDHLSCDNQRFRIFIFLKLFGCPLFLRCYIYNNRIWRHHRPSRYRGVLWCRANVWPQCSF